MWGSVTILNLTEQRQIEVEKESTIAWSHHQMGYIARKETRAAYEHIHKSTIDKFLDIVILSGLIVRPTKLRPLEYLSVGTTIFMYEQIHNCKLK